MKSFPAIKKLAREVFNEWIRIKDADSRGIVKCYTCSSAGAWNSGAIHAGHFYHATHTGVAFYEPNVHPQCAYCNVELGGNLEVYERHLREDYGDEFMEDLARRAHAFHKGDRFELIEIIETCREKIKEKKRQLGNSVEHF